MKRLAIGLVFVLISCSPKVPVNTQLWRIDEAWADAGEGVRTARGTIIVFRTPNEYVELQTALIERADHTVYIQAGRGRVSAVGTWEKDGRDIIVRRQKVARTGRPQPPTEPLCANPVLNYRLDKTGSSVTGNAAGQGDGAYVPVSRLVAVDFESYVESAKRSPVSCAPPAESD
jgi:hypothetical protein